MKWNREVDHALVSNVPEEEIQHIKQEYVTYKVNMSVKIFGTINRKSWRALSILRLRYYRC
jgi:hypothetical protein